MAGIMDKIKNMFGGAKNTAGSAGSSSVDKMKDTAGSVKDKVDGLVDKHGDKIPDPVEKAYDKVSDQAEKIIPGNDAKDDTDTDES